MIKRVWFATRRPGVSPQAFAGPWRRAVGAAADAPPTDRPVRITVCCTLPGPGAAPRHDGLGIEWFSDRAHLERFTGWSDGHDTTSGSPLAHILDPAASPVEVFDEVVMRGADWLGQRWGGGTPRFKHMAVARRAPGLSPEEFSQRWRGRAGVLRVGSGATVAIPDEARGTAYVQNHPVSPAAGDRPYDAFNEVYFDDAEGLARRVRWFAEHFTGGDDRDLIGEHWFLTGREQVLWDRTAAAAGGR
jgi:hypothetical protein